MRLALALTILPAIAAGRTPQEQAFESPEFGIRLKIPAGWTVGTNAAGEILRLSLPGKHDFTPLLSVTNLAFVEEHITLGQYREQFRQFIQTRFVDPRILDDRSLTVGGRPAMAFTWTSKSGDHPAISYKSFIEISPMRLVSVEMAAPRSMEEAAAKTFEALQATIEFFPRKKPEGTDEGVKRFGELLAKLPATDPALDRKIELDYMLGEQRVGSWSQHLKAATRDGAAGVDVETIDIIDLGAPGRLEKRTSAFLSDDLSRQRAEVEIVHRGKERRVQYFTASVALNGTELTIDRRLNGEKSKVTLTAPERAVLDDALEALEYRVLAAGKSPVIAIPILMAFDNEPGHVRAEMRGEFEMKNPSGGGLVKVNVLDIARESGALVTYWFDRDKRLLRRSVGGQGVILQERR